MRSFIDVIGENTVKMEEIAQINIPEFSEAQGVSTVKIKLNTCVCCLAENIPFVNLSNCKHVEYLDSNFKFKLQYQQAVVCYVCHGMLKVIYQFKRQVINSVAKLNTKIPSFKPYNIKLSKLEQTNVEIYFISSAKPIENQVEVIDIEPKIEVKIEHDYSDSDNDVPLSEIKQNASVKDVQKTIEVNAKETAKIKYSSLSLEKYEGKIKCVLLSETEMQEERKRDAAQEKFLKLLYRCENCIVGYDHELTLKEHMEKRHGQVKGGFTCAICTSVLTSLGSFKEHMRRHYRRIECAACGARYSTVVSALMHYTKMHAAIATTKFKCDQCEFTTPSYRRYRYHRGSHKQKACCKVCGNTFVNNSGLKVHMYTVHKVSDRVYSCDECSKTYRARSGLLAHTQSAHAASGAFCAPCRAHFRTAGNLRHHLNTHRAHAAHQDKFGCTSCDARFVTKSQLKAHVDWEHLKNIKHKCDECNKAFKTNAALKRHINYVHEKKRPPRNKMCDYCGRGFTTLSILSAHVRTHTGERPHACARCPAAFAHPAALYTHNKLLHNNK